MNDIQENKLSMYEAVNTVMDNNSTIWAAVTAVSDISTKVKSLITDIQKLRQVQEVSTKGITVSKAEIREQLTAATLKLINAIMVYAQNNNLHELMAEVNYTETVLNKSRDNIFYDITVLIQTKAAALETELANYMIKPDDITAQQALIDQYQAIIPKKRAAVVVTKASTQDMKVKFKEMDELLKNKLDRLIKMFEGEHTTFVQQYFSARIIIDLGHRFTNDETVLSGVVSNGVPDKTLEGVNVWIPDINKSFVTGTDGHFEFILENEGTYVVKAAFTGFETYTSDPVKVEKGKEVEIEISMVPAE